MIVLTDAKNRTVVSSFIHIFIILRAAVSAVLSHLLLFFMHVLCCMCFWHVNDDDDDDDDDDDMHQLDNVPMSLDTSEKLVHIM